VNNKLRQVLQFIIFFGLGGALMWWQYSGFTPEQKSNFYNGLRNADYFWFAVATVIGMISHLLRATRWQMLLEPLHEKAKLGNRFYAVMIGYLANYAFPRLGEVVRCTVVKTSDNIPFAKSFGTVVIERIVDLLCLGLIFLCVLLLEFNELQSLWQKYISLPASEKISGIAGNPGKLMVFILILLILIAAFFFLRKKVAGKTKSFFTGLKDGILSVSKVKSPLSFSVQTLLIWIGYYIGLYACFFCFNETSSLTLNSALILILFGSFGIAFTPGGTGAYQVIVTAILVDIAPATEPVAASFAWLAWGTQVATVVLFTGIAFLVKPLLNKIGQGENA
jgi:uncharacterized protein (TIRG00374 family)